MIYAWRLNIYSKNNFFEYIFFFFSKVYVSANRQKKNKRDKASAYTAAHRPQHSKLVADTRIHLDGSQVKKKK